MERFNNKQSTQISTVWRVTQFIKNLILSPKFPPAKTWNFLAACQPKSVYKSLNSGFWTSAVCQWRKMQIIFFYQQWRHLSASRQTKVWLKYLDLILQILKDLLTFSFCRKKEKCSHRYYFGSTLYEVAMFLAPDPCKFNFPNAENIGILSS